LCEAALAGRIGRAQLRWDARVALGVVMAAGGYPGSYTTGDPISGLETIDDPAVKVFHAATRQRDGQIVSDGGRVLTVVGLGDDVADAQRRAYAGVARIRFNNAYYRHDIGYRALGR